MKNLKYIFFASTLLILTNCNEPEDVDLIPVEEAVPEFIAGSADFSNYVALGASFTAGYSDGALFRAAQENSFPNLLSSRFALAGGGDFTQPLMEDNTGAFLGVPTAVVGYRLVFNGSGPQRLNEFFAGLGAPVPSPTTNPTSNVGVSNNVGVPGAKSYHMVAPGYAAANPYYARFATSASSTMLGDAASQGPTFFTLSEVGGNDVLSYATSGGVGEDQTGNPNAAEYSQLDITDPGLFAQVFQGLIAQLTANGAQGAVANLPNITDLPYFTTVPNNALVLDAGTAASLTGFFQAVAGIFTGGLIQQGVPPANAQALASQYAITFQEGPNRFLIDVPVSQTNPLGFRQMTEEELLLLPIDRTALAQGYGSVVLTPDVLQVLGLLQAGGTPTQEQAGLVLAAVSGIDDKDALDSDELLNIKNATDSYNATIETVTTSSGLAFVDLKSVLENAKANGVQSNGYTLNTSLVTGGLVSLDGIHLTSRGYAVMANEFLKAIDATYGSNFNLSKNLLDIGDYPTNYSPTLQ